jgi:hypothetical protein
MAKATVTTKSGATITFEGTQDEVAALLSRFEGRDMNGGLAPAHSRANRSGNSRPTPMGLLSELIGEGFFREPKGLGSVQLALREKGHFYPVTTLSPLMLRLVRRKELRRIKDKNRWTYAG